MLRLRGPLQRGERESEGSSEAALTVVETCRSVLRKWSIQARLAKRGGERLDHCRWQSGYLRSQPDAEVFALVASAKTSVRRSSFLVQCAL